MIMMNIEELTNELLHDTINGGIASAHRRSGYKELQQATQQSQLRTQQQQIHHQSPALAATFPRNHCYQTAPENLIKIRAPPPQCCETTATVPPRSKQYSETCPITALSFYGAPAHSHHHRPLHPAAPPLSGALPSHHQLHHYDLFGSHTTTTASQQQQAASMILEKNLHGIFMEHCYSRPHTWRPETHFLRPTKTLFTPAQTQGAKQNSNPLAPCYQEAEDVEVDVESLSSEALPLAVYDVQGARQLMDECERYARIARASDGDDNWDENIPKTNWTSNQLRLFSNMVDILNAEYLTRLSNKDVQHEPILRRIQIDKTVKRFRLLMWTVTWDVKLAQWLHQILTDNMSTPYLAIYLDLLQTIKAKMPSFVDKLTCGPNQLNRVGMTSNDSLYPLLKRQWDPMASTLQHDKPKKLQGNPIIIIVPGVPTAGPSYTHHLKRLYRWINVFSSLSTVHTIYTNTSARMTVVNCLDQMLTATRTKIQEVKSDYPNRSIVLIGFNAGSAVALQVAQVESVLCVVCIGFSLHTADGRRGELDDNLLELQSPVMFVIGQCSNTALREEMEDLRERMRVETALLVVGSADDYLRVNKKKRRQEGITQSYVDRCIVDEVGAYISDILLSPYPPQIRQSTPLVPGGGVDLQTKRSKASERKRNNSNGSSLDSEPPSPVMRTHVPRPVGRPPGKKMRTNWPTFNPSATATIQPSPAPSPTLHPPTPIISTLATVTPTQSKSYNVVPTAPRIEHNDSAVSTAVNTTNTHPQHIIHKPVPTRKAVNIEQDIQIDSGNNSASIKSTPKTTSEKPTATSPTKSALVSGQNSQQSTDAKLQALASRGVVSHPLVTSVAVQQSQLRDSSSPKLNSAIKVLNNIAITTYTTPPKTTPTTSPPVSLPVDMSKMPQVTIINTKQQSQQPSSLQPGNNQPLGGAMTAVSTSGGAATVPYSNVIITTGGKIKHYGMSIRGTGSTPLILTRPAITSQQRQQKTTIINTSQTLPISASIPNINRFRPKIITSKKQLITGSKPIRTQAHIGNQHKFTPYVVPTSNAAHTVPTTLNHTLPPPTNLTTQDIMDLPIIFADDNSLVLTSTPSTAVRTDEPTVTTVSSASANKALVETHQVISVAPSAANNNTSSKSISSSITTTQPTLSSTHLPGKLVLVNKSNHATTLTSAGGSNVFQQHILKRPVSVHNPMKTPSILTTTTTSVSGGSQTVKYTKIILSKCLSGSASSSAASSMNGIEEIKAKISTPTKPTDLSLKKIGQSSGTMSSILPEPIDLEKELVASKVPNPNFHNKNSAVSGEASGSKLVTFVYKKSTADDSTASASLGKIKSNLELEKLLEGDSDT